MNSGYTLNENEVVIKVVKRHWIDLVPVVVSASVLMIGAIGLVYIASRFSDQISFLPSGLITLLAIILVLLSIAILLVGLYIYGQNKLILTDMHLIQIVQRGLFSRSVSQLSMARVQDVSAVRSGLVATLLDYGTIEVETAGEDDKFVFNLAPNPQGLADECLAVHEKYEPKTGQINSEI